MAKRVQDIRKKDNEKIDLKTVYENKSLKERAEKLHLSKNVFFKKAPSIKEVKDLSGGKKINFAYVKGKTYSPPKHLSNLIKIALVGFLIVLGVNSVRVYYQGKALQDKITDSAYQGYSFLVEAGKEATKIEFDKAIAAFEDAQKNFDEAKGSLWFISTDNSFYGKEQSTGQAAATLLEAGKKLAIAGTYFLEAVEIFNQIPVYFVSKNEAKTSNQVAENVPTISITDILNDGLKKTDLAIKEVNEAKEQFDKVSEKSLPDDMKIRITLAKEQIAQVTETLNSIKTHFPAILKLLGDRYPHRYLILLQNNNEIRPTGGFIGSYAIVDLNEGYIEKLDVHDVYDIDGAFHGFIPTPDGFYLPGNWRFRDSNYSPDFPTSAAKAKWFLQREGGPGVDTVIAINQSVLKELMEVTGPVQVGNFGKLTAENYNLLLSFVIEGKIWGAADPKHILKIFIPAFKEALIKQENLGKLGSKLFKAVQEKDILAWSGDTEIENLFDAIAISGRMHESQTNEDYLSVINASIGGTKSDQFIEENITHSTYLNKEGELINQVTIKRSHKWDDKIYFEWKNILQAYGFKDMPDQIVDILGRGRNDTVIKVYVPDGSILIESNKEGVETKYDKDVKKTYFLSRMEIKAGESDTLKIKYKLPFDLKFEPLAAYKLVVQKQPGSANVIFSKKISAEQGISNVLAHPLGYRLDEEGRITSATNLEFDRYFSSVWKEE